MIDVTPDTADRLVSFLGATGLNGAAVEFPTEPLSARSWKEVVSRVQLYRITGLFAAAVHDGILPTTTEQREEAALLHAHMMQLCLCLENDLLNAVQILDHGGIEHRVLKGPAFAHLDYPNPSLRVFGDIDLLVRSEHFEGAEAALTAEGYTRKYRQLRAGFDRRFGKGACFTGPSGREMDVHRTFVMGPFGLTIDLNEVWKASRSFTLAGRSFATLDADHRFLHACYHAALGDVRPHVGPLRDLAGMLQRSHDPVDVERVRELAGEWSGRAVVSRAVRLAWVQFGLKDNELALWSAQFRPTANDERALQSYLNPRMGYAARSFAALSAIPGVRQKVAFSWALLFPDRKYGSGRHRGRWLRWRDASQEILSLRRSRDKW